MLKRVSETSEQRYVPAAGRAAFTRLYDPVVAVTMRERRFRALLLQQVLVDRPQRIVDVGCGTGTFAIALADAPGARQVTGVDGDPEVLAAAGSKPGAGSVAWRGALADALPLPDGAVDAVTMSLLLHHLNPAGKQRVLHEAVRVLRPGGVLHVADWGKPTDPLMRAAFFGLQLLDGFDNTRDHAAGRLHGLIEEAGFRELTCTATLRTAWGSLELLRAARS